MRFSDSTTVRLVTGWASLRTALGAAALIAPQRALSVWVGCNALPHAAVLGRALAGRDLALGVGTTTAALAGQPARGWILAGGVADAADAVATLAARDQLPRGRRDLVLAASTGSAVVAGVLACRSA